MPDHDAPYYRPADGRLGDVIPFGFGDEFHVFFLDYRPERFDFTPSSARKTSWGHLVSSDLQRWERLPDAIAPSENGVDAASCATGSVVERDGVFHLYYTGRSFSPAGDRREVICEAVSTDLVHWSKREDNPIVVPDSSTDECDAFRDPHVFLDPVTGEYTMLVTTTRLGGRPTRSGALARLRSADLVTWRRDGFFWSPGISFDLECPDIFSIGQWWYLIFSTAQRVRYRRARTPEGPWLVPADDNFDGKWFYAAKSAEASSERVLFGWLADAKPERDDGARQWGGSLMLRRLEQRHDGSLGVRPARGMVGTAPPSSTDASDTSDADADETRVLDSGDGFGLVPIAMGQDMTLEVEISVPSAGRFGLIVRGDEALTTGYRIGFDVGLQTMSWSVLTGRGESTQIVRHCPLRPRTNVLVQVTLDGSVVDVLASGSAFCARAYDSAHGLAAVWTEGAALHFRRPRVVGAVLVPYSVEAREARLAGR